jgi:Fanconi anemia group I protein
MVNNRIDHDKPVKSAIDLGIKALLACFKIHEGVRPEILDQIFSRVISNEHNPLMYLKLLASIVSECTHNLLDHSNKVRVLAARYWTDY